MRIATRLDDVLAEHGALLRGLIGQPIERAWAEWYGPWDDLHSWSPIVLCVGVRQIELWTIGPGEFGVTCDTLDLGRPPRHSIVGRDDASWWVGDRPAVLQRLRGVVVRRVRLLAAGELCGGIELAFDGWALTVWNDADDVGVTDEPLDFDASWVDV